MPPPSTMYDWARHLFADEAAKNATSTPRGSDVVIVYEKLHRQLSAPLGVDGFRALASRALTLAKSEAPRLGAVQVAPDGRLRGLGELEPAADSDRESEAGVILIAHLLGLFLALVGAATTQRLVQDVFPRLEAAVESRPAAQFDEIDKEIAQLKGVGDRLDALARENPGVTEDGLAIIAENVRRIATVLDVFASVKSGSADLLGNESRLESSSYMM